MLTLKTVKQSIENNILRRLLDSSLRKSPSNQDEYIEMIHDLHISLILYEEIHSFIHNNNNKYNKQRDFIERQYEIIISDYFVSEWFQEMPYGFETEGNEERVITILYEIIQYPQYEVYEKCKNNRRYIRSQTL